MKVNGARLLLAEELERLNDQVPPGRSAAHRNELMRNEWRRLRTELKAVSSVPADRLRRRLS
jgi:hypothetical protein